MPTTPPQTPVLATYTQDFKRLSRIVAVMVVLFLVTLVGIGFAPTDSLLAAAIILGILVSAGMLVAMAFALRPAYSFDVYADGFVFRYKRSEVILHAARWDEVAIIPHSGDAAALVGTMDWPFAYLGVWFAERMLSASRQSSPNPDTELLTIHLPSKHRIALNLTYPDYTSLHASVKTYFRAAWEDRLAQRLTSGETVALHDGLAIGPQHLVSRDTNIPDDQISAIGWVDGHVRDVPVRLLSISFAGPTHDTPRRVSHNVGLQGDVVLALLHARAAHIPITPPVEIPH